MDGLQELLPDIAILLYIFVFVGIDDKIVLGNAHLVCVGSKGMKKPVFRCPHIGIFSCRSKLWWPFVLSFLHLIGDRAKNIGAWCFLVGIRIWAGDVVSRRGP